MAVVVEELETEGVNGPEPRAVKRRQNIRAYFRSLNLFPGALLHFVRGAVGESEYDKARQRLQGIRRLRELRDAISHGAGLAGTSRRHDGKIAVERLRKTIARRLIAWIHDQPSSSAARSG